MSPATPQQKRRRLIIITISVLLALFCWAYFAPSELDRYKAQLIAQGEILDLDQLAPKRTGQEPDGDAPLLAAQQQITNSFQLASGWFDFEHTAQGMLDLHWYDHSRNSIPPNWTNAIAEISARQADFLLLHPLLKDPPKEKGSDYRNFLNYKPADKQLRGRIGGSLHQAVIVSAYTRDGAMAFTNLTTLLSLAQLHREEWDILYQPSRVHLSAGIFEKLNYCLHLHLWNESQLSGLQAKVESISLVTNTIQTLVFERARLLAWFAMARRDHESFLTNLLAQPMSARDKFRVAYWHHLDMGNDELAYLKLCQARLDIFRGQVAGPAWAGTFHKLQTQQIQAYDSTGTWWTDNKFTMRHAFNNWSGFIELAYTETRRQQAITVLALERYRLKHNRYPDTLTQLIPDYLAKLPQDPMDGRPMRYRLNPDATFTLWSSGFDGKDNGGDPSMPDPRNRRFPHGALDLPWPKIDPADLPPKP